MAELSGINTNLIDKVDGFFTTSGGGTPTTTPTFTLDSATTYFNNGIKITNTGAYTNPQYKVVVTIGGVVVNTILSTSSTIPIPDTLPAGATVREVDVTAQEYGDFVESSAANDSYTKITFSFRYWRVYGSTDGITPSVGWVGIRNFRVYSSSGQSGTQYPEDLTSDTSGEANGYFVDNVYFYSATYPPWKAFDNDAPNTWWWSLSVAVASQNYVGFHFDPTIIPTLPTQTSLQIKSYSNPSADYILLRGSNTGAFAGEETTLEVLDLRVGQNLIFNLG
jgi:hypothetical protein